MTINALTPVCNINILKGVPFDSSYTDTMSFSDIGSQASFFLSKVQYSVPTATPVRMQNAIRVPFNADTMYACNYIMFQNTNFGTKWFYAFIDQINYINPNMSEIQFSLDVMQTWYFDYTLQSCMVEREHTLTDAIGEHLIPEPYQAGEMVLEAGTNTGHMGTYEPILIWARDSKAEFKTIGGVVCGCAIGHGTESGMESAINTLVEDGKADEIVTLYYMPSDFVTDATTPVKIPITINLGNTNLGGYVPRNKKLLSYPYNYLMVSNSQGNSVELRYEYFADEHNATFYLSCPMATTPQVILWPTNYNNQSNNYDNALTLTDFPLCAFPIDTYKQWFAQNANSFLADMGTGLVNSVGLTALTGSPLPLIREGMSGVNQMAQLMDMMNRPNATGGRQASNAMCALRAKDFYFFQCHTRRDIAETLDGIFDMYGYQVNALKVPNVNGRPSWNYVKTADCKATGNIPFGDMSQIKSIYNRGITFWHGDYVGDYSRSNTV